MADADTAEVKDVERIEVAPAAEGSETIEPGETGTDSSTENNEGTDAGETDPNASPDGKPEALHRTNLPAPAPTPAPAGTGTGDGLSDVPGETPRERALRLEVTTLKGKLRTERVAEIIPPSRAESAAPPARGRELTEDQKKVLGKYSPEQIQSLREVLPILAEEQGYVKSDTLGAVSYTDKAQEVLDGFLDKHPEYSAENDKDGVLWKQFQSEFQLFAKPNNPKDYAKIFERVHQSVFGIQPAGNLPNTSAQQRKVQSASHVGSAQGAGAPQRATGRQAAPQGLRLDMLKGFNPEELEEIENSAG